MEKIEEISGILQQLVDMAIDCGLEGYVPIIKRLWVNDADLIAEYRDQASLFGYVAAKHESTKVRVKEVEAVAYQECRTELESSEPKVTEAMVNARLTSRAEIVQIRQQVAFLGALTEAYKQRTQMLISIGADLREEQKTTEMPLPRVDKSAVFNSIKEKAVEVVKKSKKNKILKRKRKS